MPSLDHFQSEMCQALGDSTHPCPELVNGQSAGRQSRRFNIYRNNRAVSLIDNLKAVYPAVYALVGQDYFNAVARTYIDQHPPAGPVMAEYGEGFGAFLTAFPGSRQLPYMIDVARIEWACNYAYHAEDQTALELADLAQIPPHDLPMLQLQIHPACTLVQSNWPAGSIWSVTLNPQTNTDDPDMSSAEAVVITRPAFDVNVHTLSPLSAEFLKGLQSCSIADAATQLLEKDSSFDTGQHLAHLVSLGLFSSLPAVT